MKHNLRHTLILQLSFSYTYYGGNDVAPKKYIIKRKIKQKAF